MHCCRQKGTRMTDLVAKDSEEVPYGLSVVLAVLAEVVEERAVDRLLPVVADDLRSAVFEGDERWRRWVALHDLEPVAGVADEEEAFLGVPEERVEEHGFGRWPGEREAKRQWRTRTKRTERRRTVLEDLRPPFE